MPSKRPYRRSRKLIKPRLQLKLTLTFVGLSALSLLLQFLLFQSALAEAALGLPNDSGVLLGRSTDILLRVLAASFLIFLPLTFLVGVLTTFRIAGPIYRFEQFLGAVRRGERPPDFRLRRGDQLTELAALINEATSPLRANEEQTEEPAPVQEDPPSLAHGSEQIHEVQSDRS